MYQVMIIDDEEPVLDSFAFILEKDVTDFVLCGKARSGTEAVRLIPELTPDLVFMDIQMPGIDGLEVIRQIRPQFPNIVFILATAYERFDIARKAIPLGVFSYMVKPVSKKKLLKELADVKIHLDQLKERDLRGIEDIQLLKKTKVEKRNNFLRSLIWRNREDEEWEEFLRIENMKSSRGALYLLGVVGDLSEDLKIKIYETITDKIHYKYKFLGTIFTGRILLFFPEEQNLYKLSIHFKEILNNLNLYNFVLGEGGVYSLSAIHSSFSEAFLPFAEASEKEELYSAGREQVNLICNSLLNADNPGAKQLFEIYWNEVFNKNSFYIALGKMVALFTVILSKLDYQMLSAENFNIDPAEEIMVLKTIEEWHLWSEHIFIRLQDLVQANKNRSYPKPLTAALVYIRENYQKPLQLSMVAEQCNITGSYLSRLFTEHLGITFIDYLNRFRLNKAIILLEEKKYSIKEISYLVGYQDPNYFSRIFRRHMGISPSELEKEGLKNDL